MNSCECKTIQVLKRLKGENSLHGNLAATCLRLIEDIRESGHSDYALKNLHEFLDIVYADSALPMLDHLLEGTDCDICKAIASRLGIPQLRDDPL